jgi:polyisoprenoid-binding protein YceI
MAKHKLFILAVFGLLLLAGGVWLYDWVLGDTLEASQPISAVPLPSETSAPLTSPTIPSAEITGSALQQPPIETVQETQETALPQNDTKFSISQSDTQARFMIFEELNGQPTDVVGITNQVAGEAIVNLDELSQTRLGIISVNARTLVTDQDRRNQAIRNRILQTDQFEYITFSPIELTGLDGRAVVGQNYTFQISGDLTIRDITQPVVFDSMVTLEADGSLRGIASTVILREAFNLIIPSVPFVANVGENVSLEIEFLLISEP